MREAIGATHEAAISLWGQVFTAVSSSCSEEKATHTTHTYNCPQRNGKGSLVPELAYTRII